MGGSKATGGGSAIGGGKATGGGSAMGGGKATGSAPDATSDAIKAFIMAGTYKSAPWKSDVAAARAASSGVSPHGMVRVWFNDTIQTSSKAGNGAMGKPAHTEGSMVVKEMYDAGAVVGHAAMLKKAGAAGEWAYYCEGPMGRCGSGVDTTAKPYFSTGGGDTAACAGCHFGTVFTPAPAP